jgi:signal transduction protein with GAF and PtsI domain
VETINRMSSSMRETLSQTEMCNILLNETLDLLDASNGSVWIHSPSTNTLVQRAARGVATGINFKRLKPTEGIVGHVFTTGQHHISPNLEK